MARPSTLTEGPIASTLVRLATPIVISNMLQTAYQLTDTFWVGRLSSEAVAAVSLAFPINFLMIAIGGGLPIAGTVLIAQYRGRGDTEAMDHVASQTCLMVSVVSLLLSGGGYFLSPRIMAFMGAAPDVLPDATRFLRMTFLGFIFVFGFFVFQTLTRGLGVVVSPMLIVLGTVLLNFALDPLFIFGWGPIPPLGVAGAALATLITQAIAALVGFTLLFRGVYGIRLRWNSFRPDFKLIWRMLKIGIPASIEQSTRATGMALMMLLVSGFGTVVVAAYGIGMRVLSFVVIPALGLSLATSTLVGQNIGAGKIDRATRTSRVACLIAFSVLSLAGIVMFLSAEAFATFIVPKAGEAIPIAVRFIRVMSLTFGFIGVQQVVTGTLRGAGDTLAAMILAIIALWVLQFPLAYVLSHHTSLGPDGIWWALAIANMISACITVTWLVTGNWKEKRLIEDIELQQRVREEVLIDEGAA